MLARSQHRISQMNTERGHASRLTIFPGQRACTTILAPSNVAPCATASVGVRAVAEGWVNRMGGRSMLIALVVAVAFFMENLDATIIVTALPQMAGSFHIDASRMSMGVTAYLMAAAACVTVSGWLADRVGTRTLFCGAVGLFTLASMLCGAAPNFTVFMAGRIVQGAAAAMMSPVGRLVVLRSSQKKDLMRALS